MMGLMVLEKEMAVYLSNIVSYKHMSYVPNEERLGVGGDMT
jgi:hypothetical protein